MTDEAQGREWLTVQELAKLADVSGARIRQLLLAGKLRGERIGPVWTISRAEAARFLSVYKRRRRSKEP
jgi:excisionase family DNA binding protein